jgi:hypothetical protein
MHGLFWSGLGRPASQLMMGSFASHAVSPSQFRSVSEVDVPGF